MSASLDQRGRKRTNKASLGLTSTMAVMGFGYSSGVPGDCMISLDVPVVKSIRRSALSPDRKSELILRYLGIVEAKGHNQ